MTDEPSRPPARPLTEIQRTRLDFARRDLEQVRVGELIGHDTATLILVVERLRGRLHDVLELVDEITHA
jgi:hypothetical protein